MPIRPTLEVTVSKTTLGTLVQEGLECLWGVWDFPSALDNYIAHLGLTLKLATGDGRNGHTAKHTVREELKP